MRYIIPEFSLCNSFTFLVPVVKHTVDKNGIVQRCFIVGWFLRLHRADFVFGQHHSDYINLGY